MSVSHAIALIAYALVPFQFSALTFTFSICYFNSLSSEKMAATKSATPVEIPEAEVKTCKMSSEMEEAAKEYVKAGIKKYAMEKEVAEYVKRKFDKRFGPKWHCIVGRHFASHVSYEPDHYIYMKIGEEVVLLFKSGGSGMIKSA